MIQRAFVAHGRIELLQLGDAEPGRALEIVDGAIAAFAPELVQSLDISRHFHGHCRYFLEFERVPVT